MTLRVCVTDFDVVHPAVGAIKLNFRIYTLDEFLAPRASEIGLGLRRPHRPRCGSSIAGVALDQQACVHEGGSLRMISARQTNENCNRVRGSAAYVNRGATAGEENEQDL